MILIELNGKKPFISSTTFVAQNATLIGDVLLEERSSIWFGVVLRADSNTIRVGEKSNIQDLCLLHVDREHAISIGKGVTVGHRVILHGCFIDDDALIGMGAIVMNGARVGCSSLIAAGSVVTEGMIIPPRSLVMGTPAKIRRELTDDEVLSLRANAEHYVRMGTLYRDGSPPL